MISLATLKTISDVIKGIAAIPALFFKTLKWAGNRRFSRVRALGKSVDVPENRRLTGLRRRVERLCSDDEVFDEITSAAVDVGAKTPRLLARLHTNIVIPEHELERKAEIIKELAATIIGTARRFELSGNNSGQALDDLARSRTQVVGDRISSIDQTLKSIQQPGLTMKQRRELARELPASQRIGVWREAVATAESATTTPSERAVAHALLGFELVGHGELNEGLAELRTANRICPTAQEAILGRALSAAIEGHGAEARKLAFETEFVSDALVVWTRGQVLLRAEDYAAVDELVASADLNLDVNRSLRRIGAIALGARGRHEEALALIQASKRREDLSFNAATRVRIIEGDLAAGSDPASLRSSAIEARDVARNALSDAQNDGTRTEADLMRVVLASAEAVLGNEQRARAYLDSIESRENAQLLVSAARIFARISDTKSALKALEVATTADLQPPDVALWIALLQREHGAEALDKIAELRTKLPSDLNGDLLIVAAEAEARLRWGDISAAEEQVADGLLKSPNDVHLRVIRLRLLVTTSKEDEARALARELGKQHADSAVRLEAADALVRLGEPTQAVEILTSIGIGAQSNRDLVRVLARALHASRTEAADTSLESLARARPEIFEVARLWADSIFRRGDADRALRELRAIFDRTQDVKIRLAICQIYTQHNMIEEARAALDSFPAIADSHDLISFAALNNQCGRHEQAITTAAKAVEAASIDKDIAYAYFQIFMAASEPIAETLTVKHARPGTVVTLLEGQEETFVHFAASDLQLPGVNLRTTRGDALGRALLDRRSGESIAWTEGTTRQERVLTNVQDERVYLLNERTQFLEGDSRLVKVPITPDFAELGKMAATRREHVRSLIELAKANPMPLRMLATGLGGDILATRRMLEQQEEIGLKVQCAERALSDNIQIVTDAGTLIALADVQALMPIVDSGIKLVTTNFAVAELTQLQQQLAAEEAHPASGVLVADRHDKPVYLPRQSRTADLELVRTSLRVVQTKLDLISQVRPLNEREEDLVDAVGRDAIAAAVCAQEQKCILLCDDAVVAAVTAEVLKSEAIGVPDLLRHMVATSRMEPVLAARMIVRMCSLMSVGLIPSPDEFVLCIGEATFSTGSLQLAFRRTFRSLTDRIFAARFSVAVITEVVRAHPMSASVEDRISVLLLELKKSRHNVAPELISKAVVNSSLIRLEAHSRIEELARRVDVTLLV